MRYFRFKKFLALAALTTSFGCVAAMAQTRPYSGIGTPATPEDPGPRAWTSGPSGRDLPPGKGTAKQGATIYMVKCSMCHGRDGQGVKWDPGKFSVIAGPRLAGGNTTPHFQASSDVPPPPGQITTLAYYAPWATVIFNTIATEMPMFNAGTLKPDEVYSLTAWVLLKNGLVKEDDVMDRETLPKVQMPNRNGFPPEAKWDELFMDMNKRGCYKTFGVCRDHY
jgi:mono/diheme cytochrome c family protein